MNNLIKIITEDGSISFRSEKFNENFHSKAGAYCETKNKFINPSRLKRFHNKSINVLDICFGIGYNSALLFENLEIELDGASGFKFGSVVSSTFLPPGKGYENVVFTCTDVTNTISGNDWVTKLKTQCTLA